MNKNHILLYNIIRDKIQFLNLLIKVSKFEKKSFFISDFPIEKHQLKIVPIKNDERVRKI